VGAWTVMCVAVMLEAIVDELPTIEAKWHIIPFDVALQYMQTIMSIFLEILSTIRA
jgi:hypothetical protein